MPQLVPFYFLNQLTYGLTLLVFLILIFSRNILPRILRLYISRNFITRL